MIGVGCNVSVAVIHFNVRPTYFANTSTYFPLVTHHTHTHIHTHTYTHTHTHTKIARSCFPFGQPLNKLHRLVLSVY